MSQEKRRSERMWQRKRGRRLERTTSHHYLGDELVVAGILSRLPAKSLLRFRCVCKSWNSLISTPQFISSQLRNCRTNNTHLIVHQCDAQISAGQPTGIRILHLEDDRCQSWSLNFGFEYPYGNLLVVGSTSGLICYAAVQHGKGKGNALTKFIILNPEIGSFLSVSKPSMKSWMKFVIGFGFDDSTLDHKIFIATPNHYVYLYSLNSSSWKLISCHDSWHSGGWATFVNGCFYWLTYESKHGRGMDSNNPPSIMVFDIKSKTFRRILFQECLLGQLRIIAGFGESSIGVVQKLTRSRSYIYHVWLMDQNGSWLKTADDVRVHKRYEGKEVLGFRNKDELIIKVYSPRYGIVSQNIKTKTRVVRDVMSLEEAYLRHTVHTHVPSLVLLDKMIA